jgi:tetratricopeptide (TPR) repeat protein
MQRHAVPPAGLGDQVSRQLVVPCAGFNVGWLPLLLIIVTFVTYWPALDNGFVQWDEQLYVMENPLLTDPNGLWKGWTTLRETERQYYPLLLTSFWIQSRLWDDKPSGYHAVNIWFHAANSILVLFLLMALGASRWAAGVGSFLFALHPIQVESVVWIVELKNLQMGFFYLAAFLCYLYHRSMVPPLAPGRGPFVKGWMTYGGTLLLYGCALLSKTAAITLPLSLLLADWLLVAPRDRYWWKGSLARIAPMLLLGIAPALITISLESGPDPASIPPMALRPFVASAALWFYLGKLAAPFSLAPIYPRWDLSAIRYGLLLAAMALGGALIFLWHFRRCVPRLATWGAGHFAATLLPVLGFIPFGYLDHSFVANHFVYLAAIGVFIGAAVGLERVADKIDRSGLWTGRRLATGLVCLILAGYVGLIRGQISIWHDPLNFWGHLATVNFRSDAVHNNFGNAYFRQDRLDEAAEQYRIVLQLKPDSSLGHMNLGLVLERQGRLPEAIEEYRRSIDSQPADWRSHFYLAIALERRGQAEEAIRQAERAKVLAEARGRTDDVAEINRWIARRRAGGRSRVTDGK